MEIIKLPKGYLEPLVGSILWSFLFHKIPIGFSPLAAHCNTVGSPRRAVWFRNFVSKVGGAETNNRWSFPSHPIPADHVKPPIGSKIVTLNGDHHNSRQSRSDIVHRFAHVIPFAALLDIVQKESALFDPDIRVVWSEVLVVSRHGSWNSLSLELPPKRCQKLLPKVGGNSRHLPEALFHVTWGFGKPSALQSTLASVPWAKALSVGSRIQRGGTAEKTIQVRNRACKL